MSRSVYLSPSTQENNYGAGDYGTEEARMNEIADACEVVLKNHGIRVCRNRPEWSLGEVVRDSNIQNVELHVAIHSNGANSEVRGCEVYCHRFDGEGERLAKALYSAVEEITPTSGRGVKEGANFYGQGRPLYELAQTIAPAALIELAFHDNIDDANWIMNNIQNIGGALAKGILNYMGIAYIEEGSGVEDPIQVLCRYHIINSPEYWRENAVNGNTVSGEYAAILIERVASLLKKGGF